MMPVRKLMLEQTSIEDFASKQSQKPIDIPLTMGDLNQALKNIAKSVSTEFLHKYEKWMKEYGAT